MRFQHVHVALRADESGNLSDRPTAVSFRDQSAHAARRRLAAKAFSMQSMLAFENTLNEKIVRPLGLYAVVAPFRGHSLR
jgi:cytochrome P450